MPEDETEVLQFHSKIWSEWDLFLIGKQRNDYFCLFGGHIQQFSGIISDSVLRDSVYTAIRACGTYLKYQESSLGQLHAIQTLSTVLSLWCLETTV